MDKQFYLENSNSTFLNEDSAVNVKQSRREKTAEHTRKLVYAALLVALTAAMSQISVPMPSGVPMTLQTFAIAFVAYFIGWKAGLGVIAAYLFLGAAGAPVFASFTGGAYKLVNVTGGFLWGFLPMVFITGLVNKFKLMPLSAAAGILGLFVCHALGVLQYSLVAEVSFLQSAATVSLPYIAKDILSVILAYAFARTVKARLKINL